MKCFFVLNENGVEGKPCINRESKILELTIQLYRYYDEYEAPSSCNTIIYLSCTQSFFMFIGFLVAHNRYVNALRLLPINRSSYRLNCFIDMSNCFVGVFFVDIQFNSSGTQPNVLIYFDQIRHLFDQEKVYFSWFIMSLVLLVIQIWWIFKLLEKLPEILVRSFSNGSP